jgi:hypothetical protein
MSALAQAHERILTQRAWFWGHRSPRDVARMHIGAKVSAPAPAGALFAKHSGVALAPRSYACHHASDMRCLYALVLILAGCAEDAFLDRPPVTLQVPISTSMLPNGLTVSVVPNHGAPLVSAVLAVHTGASVEDATTAGYSHLFEHMIFQGSQSVRSSVEFASRLAALGTRRNAATVAAGDGAGMTRELLDELYPK